MEERNFVIGKFAVSLKMEKKNYKLEQKIMPIFMELSSICEECKLIDGLKFEINGVKKGKV